MEEKGGENEDEDEVRPVVQKGGRGGGRGGSGGGGRREGGQIEGESWSKAPAPSLYPSWKRSSSDSEFSDPEGGMQSKLR